MKNALVIFFCMLAFRGNSQDCPHYLFLQKNKTIEMTIYNKKGDPNGKKIYQVSDVTTGAGVVTGSLIAELFDKKGKSIAKANSVIKCQGGQMMMDMKMMLPQQQEEQFGKAKVDSGYLEYPVNLKTGDALKDGSFTMDINTSGMEQTLTMVISNRKVDTKESVTTSAGTWDCYKISAHTKMSVKTGFITIPFNDDIIEWFAPGFGIVKSQSKYGGTAITSIK